jgi:prepilin-type N-terminal cleavage/methylation domain-containing protein
MKYNKSNQAFTLVELAIVLVIVSVIIGGILVGQNVIQSANVNSLVSKMQEFKSAFSRFQNDFRDLPGDNQIAYERWGSACAGSAANCEGDGDNTVEVAETYKAWKHLDLAEYLNGGFDSLTGTSVACEQAENIPPLAFDSLAAIFDYDPADARSSNYPSVGQTIVFGLQEGTSAATCANSGFFTSEQLFIIDKKMDDGLAYNGKILNSEDTSGCSTSAGDGTDNGTYDLANNGVNLCKLYYRLKID